MYAKFFYDLAPNYLKKNENTYDQWKNSVKRFVNGFMRRSNCSAPSPRGCPGVKGKMCVIKKGGALEKRVNLVIL